MILLVFVFCFMREDASPTDSAGFTEMRLNDRVLLLHHAPWAETMTVVDSWRSLIVVDTWASLRAAEKAKSRIEAVFKKQVSHVINTHYHWDHTFGNQAFKGSRVVGQRFCAGDGFRLCPPNHPVGDRDTLSVGDLTVLFYHMPGIHTRSNMTLFIPELGIVFGRREFAYAAQMKLEPGADPQKIVRVLEDILSFGKSIRYLIPGHGEAILNPDLNAGVKCLNGRDFR